MEPAENKPAESVRDEIIEAICVALKPLNKNGIDLTADTDMTSDLSIDSVATMEMVFELEEKFDISIPLNDLAEVFTIGELADLVESYRSGAQF